MRAWLAALLRRLVAWAQALLRRIEGSSPAVAVQVREPDGPPADWARRAAPPPPAHWLERARRAVPLSLLPEDHTSPETPGAHSQPGAPARPRRSAPSAPPPPSSLRPSGHAPRGEDPSKADVVPPAEDPPPGRRAPTAPSDPPRSFVARVFTRIDEPAAPRPTAGRTVDPSARRPSSETDRPPDVPSPRIDPFAESERMESRRPLPGRLEPDSLRRLVDEATRPGAARRLPEPPPRAFDRGARKDADAGPSRTPAAPDLPSETAGGGAEWPPLPGPAASDEEPWLDALREAERRRRLDLEQRGWPWSA